MFVTVAMFLKKNEELNIQIIMISYLDYEKLYQRSCC